MHRNIYVLLYVQEPHEQDLKPTRVSHTSANIHRALCGWHVVGREACPGLQILGMNEWKDPSRKLNVPFGLISDSGWEPVSGETDGSKSSAYCLMLACLADTWIHCVRTEEKQHELHLQRPRASPHRPSLACVYPLRYTLELWEMNKTQMRHC